MQVSRRRGATIRGVLETALGDRPLPATVPADGLWCAVIFEAATGGRRMRLSRRAATELRRNAQALRDQGCCGFGNGDHSGSNRALGDCVYIGRMPRMQVYLSDELYNIVKSQGLSPSGLLQDAVRAHCERREKTRLTQEWAQEIFAELGPPSAEEVEWAENKAREIIESLRAGAETVAARQARHPED